MYLAFGIPVRQDAAPVVLQYGAAVPSGEMTLPTHDIIVMGGSAGALAAPSTSHLPTVIEASKAATVSED
jgi:hypothetical protein